MQFSDEFIEKWEHIINSVDITDVPIDCIKKVIIKFNQRRQKTINLSTLRKQGLELEEIEMIVNRNLSEHAEQIRDVDFILDINAVAEIVQPATDQLLKGM